MNKAIIAKLTGVSHREVRYVAAGKYNNDDVSKLLQFTDEAYVRQWLGSEYTRAMSVLAHMHARQSKIRFFSLQLLKHFELISLEKTLTPKVIQRSYSYLSSKWLEGVCDAAILRAKDNDLKYYISDVYDIHLRMCASEESK